MKQDKITIHGPKIDGTYIVEFKTADGVALAFSVPKVRVCHRVRPSVSRYSSGGCLSASIRAHNSI